MLLNLRAFASLVAGRFVSPLFTAISSFVIHTTFLPPPVLSRSEPSHQIWCVPPLLVLDVNCCCWFPAICAWFVWKAYLVRAPCLFRFGKFCSFLLGNFGAPDVVIKKTTTKKGKEEKPRCRIKKRKVQEEQSILCAPYLHPAPLFLASRTSIFGAPQPSNSGSSILERSNTLACAPFLVQGFGAPSLPLCASLAPILFGFTWFQ
ncbi:hypothetical protein SEVIR_5G179533v4 [Setaria viridis]